MGAIPDWRFQSAFSVRDAKQKMRLSKAIGPAYAANHLLKSEGHMDAVMSKLFGWMDQFATDWKPMDLDHYLAYTAFDIVGELFFSQPFGFIDQGKDIKGSLAAAKGVQALGTMVGYFEWLFYLVANPFMTWLGILPLGYIYNISKDAVNQRQTNPEARHDGLALWLKTHQENPERLSLREIYASSLTVVQAGAETVSGELSCHCPVHVKHLAVDYANSQPSCNPEFPLLHHPPSPHVAACAQRAGSGASPGKMQRQRRLVRGHPQSPIFAVWPLLPSESQV